jgi:ferric-dicitrate binding protein FerR (iron transport regulator)
MQSVVEDLMTVVGGAGSVRKNVQVAQISVQEGRVNPPGKGRPALKTAAKPRAAIAHDKRPRGDHRDF